MAVTRRSSGSALAGKRKGDKRLKQSPRKRHRRSEPVEEPAESRCEPATPPPSLSTASSSSHDREHQVDVCPADTFSLAYEYRTRAPVRISESLAIKTAAKSQEPCSLYVCGTPGGGKSVTVARVLRDLSEAREIDSALHLNCTGLGHPKDFFRAIATLLQTDGDELSGIQRFAEAGAARPSQRTVLVLDEVDVVRTAALYHIFELPFLPQSRLAVIGISNALDFCVKSMPLLQATNRLPTVITFNPYSEADISAIIRARLNDVAHASQPALSDAAILFVARKVAALSGDVRVALDVCRAAALAIAANPALNPIALVVSDFAGRGRVSAVVDAISQLPTQHQVILIAIARKLRSTAKRVTFWAMFDFYKGLAGKAKLGAVSFSEFIETLDALASNDLVVVSGRKGPRNRMVGLSITTSCDDVRDAVASKPLLRMLMT